MTKQSARTSSVPFLLYLLGIIIGPFIAGCLLLIILVLLIFYYRRKREECFSYFGLQMGKCPCFTELIFFAFFLSFLASEKQQLQDTGTGQSQSEAQRPENQAKNRYRNVLPYDHARVQLTFRPTDPSSDYINASYMPGYEKEKEFIAAQGPLPGTLCDFWRLIWEQKITTLVMLTNCIENGQRKSERYWPLDYTPCTYGDITVSVVTETILPDWTIRDFSIKRVTNLSDLVHLIRHYHYTSWPDHGVPHVTSTILHFRDIVREHIEQHKNSGPALIHCSAGVGRTGTFIALDSLLRQACVQGEIGVFSFVQRLRMNRPLMIQTESQYVFLHQCLLDGIRPAPLKNWDKMEDSAVYENTLALQGYEVSHV
uniref:protein-tyrosine-phosphatase n=1 Tax=Salvator merianae TaxID=96440 RepID=A0A8D0B9M7_SALMN